MKSAGGGGVLQCPTPKEDPGQASQYTAIALDYNYGKLKKQFGSPASEDMHD